MFALNQTLNVCIKSNINNRVPGITLKGGGGGPAVAPHFAFGGRVGPPIFALKFLLHLGQYFLHAPNLQKKKKDFTHLLKKYISIKTKNMYFIYIYIYILRRICKIIQMFERLVY